jgi:hypothetical protein
VSVEHPNDDQLRVLRERGWVIVTTLDGLHAFREDMTRPVPWREAFDLEDDEGEAA